MIRFIRKNIFRARMKSLLATAVALFFVLALSVLQNNIAGLEAEIERLYAETLVNVEIRQGECPRARGMQGPRRVMGDIVPMQVVRDNLELGIVKDIYLEGGASVFLLPDTIDNPFSVLYESARMDVLVGIEQLRYFTEDSGGFIGRDPSFNMQIQFAEGENSESNFTFEHNTAIPIIISQELAERRNLAPGDGAYIIFYRPILFRQGEWNYSPAKVLGIHDGEALPVTVQEAAVVPLPALQYMLGDLMGFFSFRYTIDPALNHELAYISEQIAITVQRPRYPWREHLTADIWDQELLFGVASLQQHILLLQMLFPIAVVISAVIGASLAMLTIIQNAKNAAIMRILGMPKFKTMLALWLWQIGMSFVGALFGLIITILVGLKAELMIVAVPYLAGAIIGAAVGAVLVANRSPLDLLQVKE